MGYKDIEKKRAAGRKQMAKWRAANPEKARKRATEASRKYRKAHPEENREYQRLWAWARRTEDLEGARKKARAYIRTKKARHTRLQVENRRRARKLKAEGEHTQAQWLARTAFYGWRCAYCSVPLTTETVKKDHRIPLSRGGSDWASNLVPSCVHCNCKKHASSPKGWAVYPPPTG